MSISGPGPGPLESSRMYTPIGATNSGDTSSSKELKRRFGAIKGQLETLAGDARRKEKLTPEAVTDRIIVLLDGMKLAGVDSKEGKLKGDVFGSDQTIKDSHGTYKFELLAENLIKKGDDGQPIVDEDGKVQIDEDAVAELKTLTKVAEKIAKKIFNVGHIREEAGKVGEAFQEGLQTSSEHAVNALLVAGEAVVATIAVPVGLIVGAGKWIEEQLQPLSKSLGEAFQPILEALERAVNATGEKLKQAATTIRNGLQTMADQINQYVVDPLLLPLYNATLGPVLRALNVASNAVYQWGIDNKLYSKLETVAYALGVAAAWIESTTCRAATWLFVTAPISAYKDAKAGLEAASKAISRIAHDTYTSAAGKLTSAGEIIRETFEKLPGQAQDAARLAYNDTVAALTKARDAIKKFGTDTDAAWQTNVQPHLNRAGQAIVDLDKNLGGYGAAGVRSAYNHIVAIGTSLNEIISYINSRTFGAKLTDEQKTIFVGLIRKLTEDIAVSIRDTIDVARFKGFDATKDKTYQRITAKGIGGFWAGEEQQLHALEERVKNDRIRPKDLFAELHRISQDMLMVSVLAKRVRAGATDSASVARTSDSFDDRGLGPAILTAEELFDIEGEGLLRDSIYLAEKMVHILEAKAAEEAVVVSSPGAAPASSLTRAERMAALDEAEARAHSYYGDLSSRPGSVSSRSTGNRRSSSASASSIGGAASPSRPVSPVTAVLAPVRDEEEGDGDLGLGSGVFDRRYLYQRVWGPNTFRLG